MLNFLFDFRRLLMLEILSAVLCFIVTPAAYGADSYDSKSNLLTIPSVAVGSTIYSNVVITVGSIVGLAGGTPIASYDIYDPASNQLVIPSVQVGGTTYTNVLVTVGAVKSAGSSGSISAPGLGNFVDAPVSGMTYTTSSGLSGTTNGYGQFLFNPGDTVTFMADGVMLGAVRVTTSATTGATTVTPVDLVPGATGVTDPKVTAVAQLLSALNIISVGEGSGSNGVFTIPNSAALKAKLMALNQPAQNISTAQLQQAIDSVYVPGKYSVPQAPQSQSSLQKGVNSQSIINTVWSASCSNGKSGTAFFQADGNLIGFGSGGSMLSGIWQGSTTSAAGVSFSASDSKGYGQGTILPGATTASFQITNSTTGVMHSCTLTQIAASNALVAPSYLGGWYLTSSSSGAGAQGTKGFMITAPDGAIYGINAHGNPISGSWSTATGTGTAVTTGYSGTTTMNFNLAMASGIYNNAGTAGTVSFSPNGHFSVIPPGTYNGPLIPLVINIQSNFANGINGDNGVGVTLQVQDKYGNQVALGNQVEMEASWPYLVHETMADTMSVDYPQGMQGATYNFQLGQCTIVSGGSGPVVDTNSGNANAYPTLVINCP